MNNSATPPSGRTRSPQGFSLVEVMLVVAIIAVMASAAFLITTNVQRDSQATKLMQDVAMVNRAIAVYQASGGTVSDLTAPQDVLDRLKTRMSAEDAKQMAGLRKGLIDSRLATQIQSSEEASMDVQRAYWNKDAASFYIANSGGAGIKEFVLDEALAMKDYGTHARNSAFKLAKETPWVWDFKDGAPTPREGPTGQPNPNPGVTPGTPAPPPGALRLNPPKFSILTGDYPIGQYPMSLSLTHSNPPGTSNILFSLNGGDWRIYTDELKLNPADKVDAMVGSLDPDHWIDSDKATETYTTTPVAPVFALKFDKDLYSYGDLGGPMIPGTTPVEPKKVAGTLLLTNSDAIPLAYQSSTYFTPKWTKDGTNPISSGTAATGDAFSNGFPGQTIPISLKDYGTSSTLAINAASKSLNTGILKNSAVVSQKLGIEPTTLRAPIVTVEERTVNMNLDTQFSDLPVGAQIYYTTNGTDPGNNNGKPQSGQLYTGPFELTGEAGSTLTVVARVYPPAEYANWFIPSTSVKRDVKLPAATDFYVGGNFFFVKGSGTTMRNIAKLKGEGQVDTAFDVGTGTSENSLVGIIRQEAAGKVLAGGDFEGVNNINRAAVVRLNPDGSVDSSFNAALAGGK